MEFVGAAGELYLAFYQDIYYYIFKTVNDRELAKYVKEY